MKKWQKITGIFIAFMVGMFLFGFIITNYIIMPIYVRASKEVEVPDICGLEFENAKKVLSQKNLSGEFDIERYCEGIPPGIVVSQRPAPGRIVKQGKKIFLTLSKGREGVRVPYIIGLDINQANNILGSSDLFIGKISYRHSPSKENTVLSTNPPADSILSRYSRINLILSKGPLSFNMPDLSGYHFEDAKRNIRQLGLQLGEVTYTTNSPLCNTVILQSPRAGEEVKQGDKVNLMLGE
jgi:serine/threonine-protein kinase